MAFKDLFKRKEGGTVVGNLLRGIANKAATAINPALGAVVGKGLLMKKPGESTQQANQRAMDVAGQAGGAAVAAAGDAMADSAEAGGMKYYLKKYWYLAFVPVLLIAVLVFRPKKHGRR